MAAFICIPVHGSSETVDVDVKELPDDASEIIEVLKAESAPLDLWLQFAVEYYKQGNLLQAKQMLEDGCGIDAPGDANQTAKFNLNNALAAVYTMEAINPGLEKSQREDKFQQAVQTYRVGDRLQAGQDTHIASVGKSVLNSWMGHYKRRNLSATSGTAALQDAEVQSSLRDMKMAKQFIGYAMDSLSGEPSVPAILVKACLSFNDGNYSEALDLYKDALSKNPTDSCPAEVRLGLGHCFFHLGNTVMAEKAFNRVLQLDSDNVEALVGLAVIEMRKAEEGDDDGDSSAMSGVKRISKAFQLQPNNACSLNLLANYFFNRGNDDKCTASAKKAFLLTANPGVMSDSCFHLARVQHRAGDFAKATLHYDEAVRLDKTNTMALYGCAQMHLYRGIKSKALECLQLLLKLKPDCHEALRVFGSMSADGTGGDDSKAITSLKRSLELQPNDHEGWVELAQLLQTRDPKKSLERYEGAHQLFVRKGLPVPSEVYHNIGSLRHCNGSNFKARNYYLKAMAVDHDAVAASAGQAATAAVDSQGGEMWSTAMAEVMNQPEAPQYFEDGALAFKAVNVTSTFNYARLCEQMCNFADAESLYKKITNEHPSYVDAYLRLGCLARDRGDSSTAMQWFEEAINVSDNQQCNDAMALTANMAVSEGRWKDAQQAYNKLGSFKPKLSSTDDMFAVVGVGNIFFVNKPDKDYAQEHFKAVLVADPHNIYAANGLGNVLANKGQFREAMEVYRQVREACPDSSDTWINMAHCQVEMKQYDLAIQSYTQCLRKHSNNHDSDLYTYIARAHIRRGDEHLDLAKKALVRAVHLAPQASALQYDLAVVMFLHAEHLRHNHKALRTLKQAEDAFNDFQRATVVFDGFAKSQPVVAQAAAKKMTVNPKYAYARLKDCKDKERRYNDWIKAMRVQFEKYEAARLKQLAASQELRDKRDQAKVTADEAAAVKKEELRQRALEADAKRNQIQEEWKLQEAMGGTIDDDEVGEDGKKKRKSKKRKSAITLTDEDLANAQDSDSDDDDERPSKKTRGQNDEGGLVIDDSDDDAVAQGRSGRIMEDSDDEDAAVQAKKTKSDVFGDDSDSDI